MGIIRGGNCRIVCSFLLLKFLGKGFRIKMIVTVCFKPVLGQLQLLQYCKVSKLKASPIPLCGPGRRTI